MSVDQPTILREAPQAGEGGAGSLDDLSHYRDPTADTRRIMRELGKSLRTLLGDAVKLDNGHRITINRGEDGLVDIIAAEIPRASANNFLGYHIDVLVNGQKQSVGNDGFGAELPGVSGLKLLTKDSYKIIEEKTLILEKAVAEVLNIDPNALKVTFDKYQARDANRSYWGGRLAAAFLGVAFVLYGWGNKMFFEKEAQEACEINQRTQGIAHPNQAKMISGFFNGDSNTHSVWQVDRQKPSGFRQILAIKDLNLKEPVFYRVPVDSVAPNVKRIPLARPLTCAGVTRVTAEELKALDGPE